MKHFVGCSSQGYLYESRSGELELHPEYVGQVIDMTDVVGAQPSANGPESGPSTHRAQQGRGRSIQSRQIQPNFSALTPPQAPAQSWDPTSQGYYASHGYLPGAIGGGVPTNPWMGQPAPLCPEYLAAACELMDEAEEEIWHASGDFCEEYAVGAGVIVMPWCVCNEAKRQANWAASSKSKAIHSMKHRPAAGQGQNNARAHRNRRETVQAGDPRLVSPECRDAISQGYDSAEAMQADQQPDPYCDPSQQQQYAPQYPPQYPPQYAPPQYAPPQYAPQEMTQDDQGGYADDCCEEYECCEEQYAAGAAPSGLGSTIGGIAGGALGLFVGSPEIGAPLGAALGGAIQGGVCQASQGHGGLSPHGPGPSSAAQHKTYMHEGKSVVLAGMNAPDGLFDPYDAQDASSMQMVDLVRSANNILRAHQFSGRQRAAVAGFFDLPRYANIAEGWTEDQLNQAADWVADKVSGPVPEEEEFYVMGSSDDSKSYGPYTQNTVNNLLAALPNAGMTVSGNNPYGIDTHSHGVTLQARWDGSHVNIAITGKNFYVSKGQVWGKLDGIMPASDA